LRFDEVANTLRLVEMQEKLEKGDMKDNKKRKGKGENF